MDYLIREFKNLYCTYQLFNSIEENIIGYILGLLPEKIVQLVCSSYIERNDEGLLLVFNILTVDLDAVYISLCSVLKDYVFIKEENPNFSHILLELKEDKLLDSIFMNVKE